MSLFVAKRAGGAQAPESADVFRLRLRRLMLLAVTSTLATALAAVFLVGAAAAGFQSMNNSLVLALSDFEYHGRIQSMMLLSFSGFGMAALPSAPPPMRSGYVNLAAMGALTILCMIGYWVARRPDAACRRGLWLSSRRPVTPVDPDCVEQPRLCQSPVGVDAEHLQPGHQARRAGLQVDALDRHPRPHRSPATAWSSTVMTGLCRTRKY